MKPYLPNRLIVSAVAALVSFGGVCAAQEKAEGKPPVQPPTVIEKVPNTVVQFEMVRIPGGSFEYKETPTSEPRKVEIKPFWIGKTEVTWDEFDVFAYALDVSDEVEKAKLVEAKTRPSKPYRSPDHDMGHAGYAAISMTRQSAVMYCKWLSEKTGKKFRLATPEEWEWAARGGGDGKPMSAEETQKYAWARENSEDKMQPVGKKLPNGYGLFDMLGNGVEWVIRPGEEPLDKPMAAGGSWKTAAEKLHPGYRQFQTSTWNVTDPQEPKSSWWLSDGTFVSFRVVRED